MTTISNASRGADVDKEEPIPMPKARSAAALMVPVMCFGVMLILGLWGLDRGSMWQDESATFEVAHRSASQIVAMLRNVDVVHGLYYLFMHVWLLPGGGEVWMRVPSVIAMAVAAGAVAALGVRLAGTTVGLTAGLLFCAAPLASFYAQEGRSTALVTALVLVATRLLVDAADNGSAGAPDAGAGFRTDAGRRRKAWIGYAALMAVAVVLHEFAVLALVAHGVMLLLNRVGAAVWKRWVPVAAVCGVLVLPIAVLSKAQSGAVSWLAGPTGRTLTELAAQLLGENVVVLLVTALLVVIGLVADLRPRSGAALDQTAARDQPEPLTAGTKQDSTRRWTVSSVALPLLVTPLVLLLGVSLIQPLYHIRYVLFVLAAVPLLVARGVDVAVAALARTTSRPRLATLGTAAVVACLCLAQLPQLQAVRTISSRNNDLAAAARVVGENSQPGDAVVFMPLRYRAAMLAYPDAFTRVDDIALAKSNVEAANLRGIDRSRRQVSKAMLGQNRIWVVGRSNLAVRKGEKGAENEQAVLKAEFTKTATYRMHGMQVALYERAPTS